MTINSGGTYYISKDFKGEIAINTKEAVTIDGSDGELEKGNILALVDNIDLTIKDLNIADSDGEYVICFGNGKNNKLNIVGENNFKNYSSIDIGGGLTIDGTGSLFIANGINSHVGRYLEGDPSNLTIQ